MGRLENTKKLEEIRAYKASNEKATFSEMQSRFQCGPGTITKALATNQVATLTSPPPVEDQAADWEAAYHMVAEQLVKAKQEILYEQATKFAYMDDLALAKKAMIEANEKLEKSLVTMLPSALTLSEAATAKAAIEVILTYKGKTWQKRRLLRAGLEAALKEIKCTYPGI